LALKNESIHLIKTFFTSSTLPKKNAFLLLNLQIFKSANLFPSNIKKKKQKMKFVQPFLLCAVLCCVYVSAIYIDEANLKYTPQTELESFLQEAKLLTENIKNNISAEKRARVEVRPLMKRVGKSELSEILDNHSQPNGATYWRGVLQELKTHVEGESV
jgi:hypothetical protein